MPLHVLQKRSSTSMVTLAKGFENGKPTRRSFLQAAALAPQLFMASSYAKDALGGDFWNQPRWIWLRHYRDKDEIRTVYWANGELIESEYKKVCWFLRDRHLDKAMFMHPTLLDIIYAQCGWQHFQGINRPYMSTSGARFSETNVRTEGAAKDSRHTKGEAHDGYFEGLSLQSQFDFAKWIGGGRVGYYPNKKFIHTDIGPGKHFVVR